MHKKISNNSRVSLGGTLLLFFGPLLHADQNTPNLISDPGFERATSGFYARDADADYAVRSSEKPISGKYSLNFGLSKDGSGVHWNKSNLKTRYRSAKGLKVTLRSRPNTASSSTVKLCASAEYSSGDKAESCAPISNLPGFVSSTTALVVIDPKLSVKKIQIDIYQIDDGSTDYTVDSVSAILILPGSTPGPTPSPTPNPTANPTPTPSPSPNPTPVTMWVPALNTAWQWQLSAPLNPVTDLIAGVQAYDIDLFDNLTSTVDAIHKGGAKAICYFSAGTCENWRPDASQFPREVIGKAVKGWAGENWIDIRNATVRRIMSARLDLCKAKGFDSVEPDNVDGYTNNPGFPLTKLDQIDFNKFLAQESHARG
ncbi:MAG: endo alpha-1,4 polygalactosaminidase, partial [Bdellovibrionia bacterium]